MRSISLAVVLFGGSRGRQGAEGEESRGYKVLIQYELLTLLEAPRSLEQQQNINDEFSVVL